GKVGRKAKGPYLMQFAVDAYLNEMGITNPIFPNENCPGGNCAELAYNPVPAMNDDGSGVREFADFMTFLAPPARADNKKGRDSMNAGERTFEDIGCGSCHVATLQSGDSQIAALRHRQFHAYYD